MNITLKPRTDRPALRLEFIGRFGNQCFSYAHARALCEKNGWQLRCAMWPGKFLFEDCNDPEPDGTEEHVHEGYCQRQRDLIYTRRDCLRWFELHPDVEAALDSKSYDHHEEFVAHLRLGDYGNLGFPIVSRNSIFKFKQKFFKDWVSGPPGGIQVFCGITVLSEENPTPNRVMPDWCAFAPDFYRMMTAQILLRGNSTFSWWASTLNRRQNHLTFSPVIQGLKGGHSEHDVPYVLGNWPMMSETAETGEDLHLPE